MTQPPRDSDHYKPGDAVGEVLLSFLIIAFAMLGTAMVLSSP